MLGTADFTRPRRTAAPLLLVLALASGCATRPRPLVLDPIGPPPPAAVKTGTSGSLLVFSAFDPTPDRLRSPYRRQYTDYTVLSADGQRAVQTVRNDNGSVAGGPRRVELPVGGYRVRARANGYGTVTVPVVIRPSQETAVHLEGSVWWPRSSAIFQSDPVRLPDGEIAGWRASAETPSSH